MTQAALEGAGRRDQAGCSSPPESPLLRAPRAAQTSTIGVCFAPVGPRRSAGRARDARTVRRCR